MKQRNTYNDEEFYQKIVAELKPGADEYDRIMSEGKNPASKRKAIVPIYKYVAAASILFAIIGTSLYMMIGNEDNIQSSISQMGHAIQIDSIATPSTTSPLGGMGTDNVVAQSSKPTANPVIAHQDTIIDNSADTEADEHEQEFLYALITEVENRALAEQEEEETLYRSIVEEVTTNMSNNSNKSELIL